MLRGVWAVEDVATLRKAIAGFCDRRARLIAKGKVDPLMRHYHETGTTVLTWLIYEGLLELEFLSTMFKGSFYHELCKAHFGNDQLYLAPERIGSRNLQPPFSSFAALPFHQDSVEQDRSIEQVLNCWMPLDDGAGRTAPGVEVVRHPGRPKFPLTGHQKGSSGPGYEAVAIDRERIVAEYGDNFLAPAFEPGDGFVFSQDVIHRTHISPLMHMPRIGFEFRVFSLGHLAPWAVPDEVSARSYPLI